MRLPGVKYGQVQTMGRRDVGAPIREAAAAEQASSAWTSAMNQGLDTADKILDDIAIDKSTKAMNAYHEEKLKWQADQIPLDADGAPAWENGDQRFNNADDAARAAAGNILGGDPRAQLLFDKDADRANVQYGNNWHNKVLAWKKDDQIADANQQIDDATQKRDFDQVDEVINKNAQRGVFSQVQTEKLLAHNDANRVNSNYLTAIGSSHTVGNYMQLRKDIKTEPKLTDKARDEMSARLDNQIIENNGMALRDIMSTVEDELGLNEAVTAGDIVVHELAKNVDEDSDGFDSEAARQKGRNAQRAIWSEWKARLTKKTTELARAEGLACARKGTCLPTIAKTDDQQKHDDVLAEKLGWAFDGKTKYDKQGVESGIILAKDQRGFNYRQIMAQDYREDGYVGKPTRETLDAAMTSNDPEVMSSGVQLYKMLSLGSPGAVVAKQTRIVEEYSDVILNFPEDTAVSLIMKYKSITPDEKLNYEKGFDAQKNEFDFEEMMTANMPDVDGGFMWFDAAPQYKDAFKRKVEDKARALTAIVGGDFNAAYKAAINIVSQNYNTDQTLKTVVEKPIATSVFGGNVDDGEWAIDEMKEGIASYNDGVVPDKFSYHPLPDFNAVDNPKYIVSWVNDAGEYKAIGYDASFQNTDRGKEYLEEQVAAAAELDRQRLMALDKEKAQTSREAWKNTTYDVRTSVLKDNLKASLAELFGDIKTVTTEHILPGAAIEKMGRSLKDK